MTSVDSDQWLSVRHRSIPISISIPARISTVRSSVTHYGRSKSYRRLTISRYHKTVFGAPYYGAPSFRCPSVGQRTVPTDSRRTVVPQYIGRVSGTHLMSVIASVARGPMQSISVDPSLRPCRPCVGGYQEACITSECYRSSNPPMLIVSHHCDNHVSGSG